MLLGYNIIELVKKYEIKIFENKLECTPISKLISILNISVHSKIVSMDANVHEFTLWETLVWNVSNVKFLFK